MTQFTKSQVQRHFSPAASLAALGLHLRQIDLFGPIAETVKIAQKSVKHTPVDKLNDAFISILAGAHGLCEINTRLRSDPALQRAFGRKACAEQSVVQETLNKCSAEQVPQLYQALTTIYRQHSQGYEVMAKDYSGQRAQKLAASVREWVDDPRIEGRQVGWVRATTTAYEREVQRIAVRCRKKNGTWGIGVLISTLSAAEVLALSGQSPSKVMDDAAVLLAYASFYDARGGGVETAFKDDKQGLGITKRNKKRFEAQQMVMLLNQLAHNVLIWARRWLAPLLPQIERYGLLRLVRDVWHISGFVERDRHGHIIRIVLNQLAPVARGLGMALKRLLAPSQVVVNWGQI